MINNYLPALRPAKRLRHTLLNFPESRRPRYFRALPRQLFRGPPHQTFAAFPAKLVLHAYMPLCLNFSSSIDDTPWVVRTETWGDLLKLVKRVKYQTTSFGVAQRLRLSRVTAGGALKIPVHTSPKDTTETIKHGGKCLEERCPTALRGGLAL
jgi:hypothetical protein